MSDFFNSVYDRRKSSAKISKAVGNIATETATALVGSSNRAEDQVNMRKTQSSPTTLY